jgi:hypothetical protein
MLIIIDIIIMLGIIIFLLFSAIIYWHPIHYNGFLIFYIYYFFVILCTIKLLISIKNIILNKSIKAKIYINNILQIIVSIFYLLCIIMIFANHWDNKIWITDFGIPLFIMAISLIMFQIYSINNLKNKSILLVSNIITPITSLLLNYIYFRMRTS